MNRREALPLIITLIIVLGLPITALGYESLIRPAISPHRMIDIHASIPQGGGFGPDHIQVNQGQTVTLRFISDDVTHGIAIGPGLGVDLGPVDPGHPAEVTVTFDQPGRYTYYCNTWCSNDHWRMRGVIEVVDPDDPDRLPAPQRDPVIEALLAEGVNIDAINKNPPHLSVTPDVLRGGERIGSLTLLPAELQESGWRRSHTPQQALEMLAVAHPDTSDGQLVDVVAYLWIREIDSARLATAQDLYQKNCAGCHGETGGGDGPGSALASSTPAFSNLNLALIRRSDVLYAKIRRGGMGTGMPNWGTVFTPDETWGLVDYLWTLAFGHGS